MRGEAGPRRVKGNGKSELGDPSYDHPSGAQGRPHRASSRWTISRSATPPAGPTSPSWGASGTNWRRTTRAAPSSSPARARRRFAPGADLSGDLTAGEDMSRLVHKGLQKYTVYRKPVIAAVNGDCIAGGIELMLASDIRLAAPHALAFGLTEVKFGVYPFGGCDDQAAGADRLCARDGTADDRQADRGGRGQRRINLINRVVPRGQPAGCNAWPVGGDHRRQLPRGGAGGEGAVLHQRPICATSARSRWSRPWATACARARIFRRALRRFWRSARRIIEGVGNPLSPSSSLRERVAGVSTQVG